MKKRNYINLYNENKEQFNTYFGDNSKLYSKICLSHWKDQITFEELSEQSNYSISQIKRIITNVEEFLLNPSLHLEGMKGSINDLRGEIRMPNAFIRGKQNPFLSLVAHKIFDLCIYWYQNKESDKIPVSYIISMSPQCIRYDRRKIFLDELSKFHILLENSENLKIFESINEVNSFITFKFTEDCLNYIDPIKAFFKVLFEFHSK